jgi:hypothetical protein
MRWILPVLFINVLFLHANSMDFYHGKTASQNVRESQPVAVAQQRDIYNDFYKADPISSRDYDFFNSKQKSKKSKPMAQKIQRAHQAAPRPVAAQQAAPVRSASMDRIRYTKPTARAGQGTVVESTAYQSRYRYQPAQQQAPMPVAQSSGSVVEEASYVSRYNKQVVQKVNKPVAQLKTPQPTTTLKSVKKISYDDRDGVKGKRDIKTSMGSAPASAPLHIRVVPDASKAPAQEKMIVVASAPKQEVIETFQAAEVNPKEVVTEIKSEIVVPAKVEIVDNGVASLENYHSSLSLKDALKSYKRLYSGDKENYIKNREELKNKIFRLFSAKDKYDLSEIEDAFAQIESGNIEKLEALEIFDQMSKEIH